MNLKNILFIALCSIGALYTNAQTTIDYSLYNNSMNLINPAFAGQQKQASIVLNHKSNTVTGGIEGPTTSSLIINSKLPKNLGASFGFLRDKIHIAKFNEIIADVSYGLKLNNNNRLLFGLGFRGSFINVNLSESTTYVPNDPLFNQNRSHFNPNFTIGAALKGKKYFAHISFIDVLKNAVPNSTHTRKLTTNLGGGYRFNIQKGFDLTTSTLARIIEGAPTSIDVNTTLHIQEKYQVGLSYRIDSGIYGMFALPINKWMFAGYSYGYHTNHLTSNYQNASHEFLLKFKLGKLF